MVENSIEDVRKNVVAEIKEKVRKNQKFLSPVNKERLEYQEKLKFANGNEFVCWMQQNGIMKNPTKVARDQNEKVAKDAEYNNYKEYQRQYYHHTGRSFPMEEYYPMRFGILIGEELFKRFLEELIFENVKYVGGYHDGGLDFICKNPKKEFIERYSQFKLVRNKEYRVQLKVRCLSYEDGRIRWDFNILYNNVADIFILSAWDNRESLQPIHIWLFHREDIIRGRKFYRRERFYILDKSEYLEKLEKYELKDKLERLKELCNKLKEDIICNNYNPKITE